MVIFVKVIYFKLIELINTIPIAADINECLRFNGRCSHKCVNTPGGYHCECRAGYILRPNRRDCRGKQTLIIILHLY